MKKLYVVYDKLAESPAGPLVALPHDAVAIRMFQEIAADSQTQVSRFLSDHDLRCVGFFNEQQCHVEAIDPVIVLTGDAVIAMRNPAPVAD